MARNWGTGKGYRKHGFYWGKQVNVGNENWQVEKNWRSCTFQFLKHIALFAAPCFSWIGCFPSNHNRLCCKSSIFFSMLGGVLWCFWGWSGLSIGHTMWFTSSIPTEKHPSLQPKKKEEKISTHVDDHLYSNFFFQVLLQFDAIHWHKASNCYTRADNLFWTAVDDRVAEAVSLWSNHRIPKLETCEVSSQNGDYRCEKDEWWVIKPLFVNVLIFWWSLDEKWRECKSANFFSIWNGN